jgi:hypothetical protein
LSVIEEGLKKGKLDKSCAAAPIRAVSSADKKASGLVGVPSTQAKPV